MGYWTKNYSGPGGNDLIVRGKLKFGANAKVEGFPANALENVAAKGQAASTAADVAGVVADFNALLIKMKNAGLMEKDKFTMTVVNTVNDSSAANADRQYNTNKISSVGISGNVITVTLSEKVSALKDFDGLNGWGVHKWLGIGVSAGISPITGLTYNGSKLTADDVTEASTQCGLSSGYFVRWIAADLVLKGKSNSFKLWADGYEETEFTIRVVEPTE